MATASSQRLEEQVRRMTPISAPPDQRDQIGAVHRLLDRAASGKRPRPRCRLTGPGGETIDLPESMFYVLERVAELMARGDAITVVPVGKELTTQQAADLLNVSRQYLVRLLEDEQLPYTKTGKHRRLRIEDVLAFKKKRDRERKKALDRLSRMTEEFGGYDEFE